MRSVSSTASGRGGDLRLTARRGCAIVATGLLLLDQGGPRGPSVFYAPAGPVSFPGPLDPDRLIVPPTTPSVNSVVSPGRSICALDTNSVRMYYAVWTRRATRSYN